MLLLRVCKFFLFRESKSTKVYFGLYESTLYFQKRKGQTNIIKRSRISFLLVDIQFDVPKCIFILKKNSLKFGLGFRLFSGGHKTNFWLQFRSSINMEFLTKKLQLGTEITNLTKIAIDIFLVNNQLTKCYFGDVGS